MWGGKQDAEKAETTQSKRKIAKMKQRERVVHVCCCLLLSSLPFFLGRDAAPPLSSLSLLSLSLFLLSLFSCAAQHHTGGKIRLKETCYCCYPLDKSEETRMYGNNKLYPLLALSPPSFPLLPRPPPGNGKRHKERRHKERRRARPCLVSPPPVPVPSPSPGSPPRTPNFPIRIKKG